MDAHRISDEIGQMEWIDRIALPAQQWIGKVYSRMGQSGNRLRDFFRGKWLGHPLHPVLVHVPVGVWTIATLLDVFGAWSHGARSAADICVAFGILVAIPAAISGLTDWEPYGDASIRRVGGLHGLANVLAIGTYTISLLFRLLDVRFLAILFSIWAFCMLAVSGYLGGLLVYEKRIGSNHAPEPEDEGAQDEFLPACPASALADGKPTCVRIENVEVLLVRRGSSIFAMADRCAHMGASLAEGEVKDECIVCPWHQSKFRLRDGEPVEGPSVFNQPTFPIRIMNGYVYVCAVRPDTADPNAYLTHPGNIELL